MEFILWNCKLGSDKKWQWKDGIYFLKLQVGFGQKMAMKYSMEFASWVPFSSTWHFPISCCCLFMSHPMFMSFPTAIFPRSICVFPLPSPSDLRPPPLVRFANFSSRLFPPIFRVLFRVCGVIFKCDVVLQFGVILKCDVNEWRKRCEQCEWVTWMSDVNDVSDVNEWMSDDSPILVWWGFVCRWTCSHKWTFLLHTLPQPYGNSSWAFFKFKFSCLIEFQFH